MDLPFDVEKIGFRKTVADDNHYARNVASPRYGGKGEL